MRWFRTAVGFVAGVLVAASVSGVRGDGPAPQADAGKAATLEGTWVVVSAKKDGEDRPQMKGDRVTITKGKLTIKQQNGDKKEADYQADTSKTPHHLDLSSLTGNEPGETFKGIFTLQGNRLTLCLAPPGKERPTEASLKDGSGCILIVLETAKP